MNKPLQTATSNIRDYLTKVPQITVLFWITKVLTTGMGETFSDFLVHLSHPVIPVALAGIVLIAALILQFLVRRYIAWIYWLSVVMISIVGTMVADVLHHGLGIPYVTSTMLFLSLQSGIFMRKRCLYTVFIPSAVRRFIGPL
jgi:Uncharacterized membrane-anchored protein conserved in bacteria